MLGISVVLLCSIYDVIHIQGASFHCLPQGAIDGLLQLQRRLVWISIDPLVEGVG